MAFPRSQAGQYSETEPLLQRHVATNVATSLDSDPLLDDEVSFRDLPTEKRQLGLVSAAFLIFNRVIGTGIFATSSVILRCSGSVGMSFVMWLLGISIAACGTAVYIELGTGLPRSGGEKNYLEFIFRRPKFLATCIYAMYAVLIGWQAASSTVFGEYALHAYDPTRVFHPAAARVLGVLCTTFAFAIHSTHMQWGIRIQNTLGVFKLVILLGIALSGLAVFARLPGFTLQNPPDNLEWGKMWEGSGSGGINAFVTGFVTVIWSFVGYSNANYALSEIRDPVRTIRQAAPLAVFSVSIVYMLVNVAYYAVVDKEEILGSGRIVAALFFGTLWGVQTERIVSAIVAMSTLANVMAVLFTHGRVIQELGREGILPFSEFFASNKPFDAPFGGLLAQWLVTSTLVLVVPAGDAYLFMLNMSSYPMSLINMFVSAGLVFLHVWPNTPLRAEYDWHPPFRTWTPVVIVFFLSNVFLMCAPLVPPIHGFKVYDQLPYWLHVLVSCLISLVGVGYWYTCYVWLPERGGYTLTREWVQQEDDTTRRVVKKVKKVSEEDS